MLRTHYYDLDGGDTLTIELGVPVGRERIRMSPQGLAYQRGAGEWQLIEWARLADTFDKEASSPEATDY